MISECLDTGEAFGVVLIRDGDEAGDSDVMPHDVGTTAEIADVTPLPAGRYYISTTGRRRFRIENVISREPFLMCNVEYLDEEISDIDAVEEISAEVRDEFREYLRLLVEFSGTTADIDLPSDPVDASYLIGDALQVADSMKQKLLETSDTHQRLKVELGFLRRLLPQLRTLLERKAAEPPLPEREDAPGGAFRAHQEKFFGKHFSLN